MSKPRVKAAFNTYDSIQALRGVAAVMVVLVHTTQFWERSSGRFIDAWLNGAAGVDLFFVISGIVMILSTHGRPLGVEAGATFLKRRGLRLLPMYWLVTVVFVAFDVLALHHRSLLTRGETYPLLNWQLVVTSFGMLPYNDHGWRYPEVGVGWTLRFETFFYLLFAASLSLRMKPHYFLPVVLLPVALLCHWYAPNILAESPFLLLEFIFGVFLALMLPHLVRIPSWGACAMVAAGSLALLLPVHHELPSWRALVWGVPAVAILAGLLSLEQRKALSWPRWLLLLGDASYSLYLVHILALRVVMRLLEAVHIAGPGRLGIVPQVIAGTACVASALALGLLCYRRVELPLNDALRKRFLAGKKLQTRSAD